MTMVLYEILALYKSLLIALGALIILPIVVQLVIFIVTTILEKENTL